MPTRGKRPRTTSVEKSEDDESMNKVKKLKLLASHTLASPFPQYIRPTRSETFQIHDLLSKEHPSIATRRKAPSAANNSARTCGSVPNVLESLIGTILSQNTAGRNSTAAKRNLDETFGKNNFEAIATAPRAQVVEAIRRGGLANKKAGVIQTILEEVKDRYGDYSLQHLAGVVDQSAEGTDIKGKTKSISNEEAMSELISFEGVGPKTASCVLLFCLGRSSFPVDTHVFRLARLLGWVPLKADRVTAQAHLDLTIPDELKYGLHVLMVGHGKRCKGCKGPGAKGDCVLKSWLKEQKGVKSEDVDQVALEADVETGDSEVKQEDLSMH